MLITNTLEANKVLADYMDYHYFSPTSEGGDMVGEAISKKDNPYVMLPPFNKSLSSTWKVWDKCKDSVVFELNTGKHPDTNGEFYVVARTLGERKFLDGKDTVYTSPEDDETIEDITALSTANRLVELGLVELPVLT